MAKRKIRNDDPIAYRTMFSLTDEHTLIDVCQPPVTNLPHDPNGKFITDAL